MGNSVTSNSNHCKHLKMEKQFTSIDKFEFHGLLEEQDLNNGSIFNGIFIPDEILIQILSFIPPKQLLPLTLVCKKWCNIVKSEIFWMEIYNYDHPNKAKLLPWYVYYLYYTTPANFSNLLKNGNGQEQFAHWDILKNLGDEFRIEDPPCGTSPLPEGVSDFNGHTCCFATSYYECTKIQKIHLEKKRLLRYVMNKYKPQIIASEWISPRFDCGSKYTLTFKAFGEDYVPTKYSDELMMQQDIALIEESKSVIFQQWSGKSWEKVEVLLENYPDNVMMLVFEHEGNDTQFWKGHYGSKMAGGVVRFVFDSIKPEKKTN